MYSVILEDLNKLLRLTLSKVKFLNLWDFHICFRSDEILWNIEDRSNMQRQVEIL